MADDADRAAPNIDAMIAAGVARAREESARALKPLYTISEDTGKRVSICLYCQSEVDPGRLFCDRVCSDAHEHERLRRKANGL